MSNTKGRTPNDQRSDVKNENNAEFRAAAKNHEKQVNSKPIPQGVIPKLKEKQ
jgi:hypothetical protein